MGIEQARLLEDCAHNLRIGYELTAPVDEAFFASAGADQLTVHRFSQYVQGARDHLVAVFRFDDGPPVRAEGAVGATQITATFGSLHGAARPEAVAALEQRLTRACQDAGTSSTQAP